MKRAASTVPQGGYKQKAKWAAGQDQAAESSGRNQPSALAQLLIIQWAWGFLSTPLIQKIAAAAVADGVDLEELKQIAKLGKHGTYPNHMYSELINKLRPPPLANALIELSIFMKTSVDRIIEVSHVMLAPHAFFAALYKYHRDDFIKFMCGGSVSNIKQFWTSVRKTDHPGYRGHPIQRQRGHTEKCIPIKLHSDGVPVTGVQRSWGKSIEVWSWSSYLVTGGATIFTQFLIYFLYKGLTVSASLGRNCRDAFMKKLVHSLYWLQKGKWPTRNEDGIEYTPEDPEWENAGIDLADGFCAILWYVLGDLENMNSVFHFPHQNNKEPCGLCQCNCSTIPWTDARITASWIDTIYTNSQWWALFSDTAHVIFAGKKLPGVGIMAWVPDVMHCKHIGADCYFFGSVLAYLVNSVMSEDPESNMKELWALIREFYKDNATSKGQLKFGFGHICFNSNLYFVYFKLSAVHV